MRNAFVRWVGCGVVLAAVVGFAGAAHAQNLLVNGGVDGAAYFDGSDPTVADDVPGWILSLGAADGSYVLVSAEATAGANGFDCDMGVGPAGGGLATAPGSRPTVAPGFLYTATLTYDNYFAPASPSYFIDWFDASNALISSDGGLLADPNGPLTYAPYTQTLSISGTAPATAVTAGVRFDGGNGGYNGLAVDNFTLTPEPASASVLLIGGSLLLARRRRA